VATKTQTGTDFSDAEIARRRDEVVHRMANTPPQPRVTPSPKPRRKKAAPGQKAGEKKVKA
jgi:hypothetical protein